MLVGKCPDSHGKKLGDIIVVLPLVLATWWVIVMMLLGQLSLTTDQIAEELLDDIRIGVREFKSGLLGLFPVRCQSFPEPRGCVDEQSFLDSVLLLIWEVWSDGDCNKLVSFKYSVLESGFWFVCFFDHSPTQFANSLTEAGTFVTPVTTGLVGIVDGEGVVYCQRQDQS